MSDISALTGAAHRFCPGCGYDLRGIDSDRCPECGLGTDQAVSGTSVIPWAHRRRIGRVRAYLTTAKLAIFRPEKLAIEVARPVQLEDALAFRRVTAAIATVPCVLLVIGAAFLSDVGLSNILQQPEEFGGELLAIPVAIAAIWFFFLTIAGVQSYWFHPASLPMVQQNRAVAVSYYATAPLAITPISAFLGAGIVPAAMAAEHSRDLWFMIPALCLTVISILVIQLATMWRACLVMLRRTTHCGLGRTLSCAIGLPVAWLMLAVTFLAVLPGAYLFVALLILSHR
jgi:hypothetical protein